MNSHWAAENLQTIRTLMERSALYRRTLAPVMVTVGCIGLLAALVGFKFEVNDPGPFIVFWLVSAVIAAGAGFFMVRRQAIQDSEPVWSPPARRVIQAGLPALTAGLLISLALLILLPRMPADPRGHVNVIGLIWLPLGWVVLYGCAVHASGFFLPRGMKLFGWIFVLGGCVLFAGGIPDLPRGMYGHGIMGLFFGLLHQAYGVYLYLTEKKESRP